MLVVHQKWCNDVMQRTELVQVRMTPAEKALVAERAGGKTVSEFLRGLGLGSPAPKKTRGAAALEVGGVPVVVDPAMPPDGFEVVAPRPVFRCPWDSCEFRARSPKVTCPAHGRKVIPA